MNRMTRKVRKRGKKHMIKKSVRWFIFTAQPWQRKTCKCCVSLSTEYIEYYKYCELAIEEYGIGYE
jgi:hypothetical protein